MVFGTLAIRPSPLILEKEKRLGPGWWPGDLAGASVPISWPRIQTGITLLGLWSARKSATFFWSSMR